MRIVVTGGGTGGHVYPALEVARGAAVRGWTTHYVGSLRGQESRECQKAGIEFSGFDVEPIYKLTSLRGVSSGLKLMRATTQVGKWLDAFRPDVVFSTGGYASAACVSASKKRRIPYVLHEQNAAVGRSVAIFARDAYRIATVFRGAADRLPAGKTVRTGMPLRREFRKGQGTLGWAQGLRTDAPILIVMGGSQGAVGLNDAALATAVRMAGESVQWLHVTGERYFRSTEVSLEKLAIRSHYEIRAYLDAEEMAAAMFSSTLAVCRAGAGTLSELAAYRKPAVLVPYPHAYADHQLHNAREFESMGAADVLTQSELQASTLHIRVAAWLHNAERRDDAARSLAEWDQPNAVEKILDLLQEAVARQIN